jgi:hypothetical protein
MGLKKLSFKVVRTLDSFYKEPLKITNNVKLKSRDNKLLLLLDVSYLSVRLNVLICWDVELV